MPVRFRCQYCNQLLGIARRKIGMQVSCPTCQNKLTVPPADAPDADQPARKKDPLFEGSDLDALLQPGMPDAGPEPQIATAPPPGAWPASVPAPPPFNVEPYNPPGDVPTAAPSASLVQSPYLATLLVVGLILLLAVFFVAGLLVGRFLL